MPYNIIKINLSWYGRFCWIFLNLYKLIYILDLQIQVIKLIIKSYLTTQPSPKVPLLFQILTSKFPYYVITKYSF